MEAGLTVFKFSIDALDDEWQKKIRGNQNNFETSYRTLLEIIDYCSKKSINIQKILNGKYPKKQTQTYTYDFLSWMEDGGEKPLNKYNGGIKMDFYLSNNSVCCATDHLGRLRNWKIWNRPIHLDPFVHWICFNDFIRT